MSLSDSDQLRHVPSNKRRATNAPTNKRWSDSQKIEAVTTYLALGNLVLTGNVLKIPEMTLRSWKQTAWWKEIEDDLKVQEDLQLSSRLKRIIDNALTVTEDRIKNGNFIYDNKTGQLVRKPVDLKDAHKVTMEMVDKREVLMGRKIDSIPLEQIESKLEKLAQKFAQIASGNRPVEVTDVIEAVYTENEEEIDNAIHTPEREEGLQT